ncbi:asparagine synthase, putative [Babesia bigemina]|uniref:Asparagine synthase, putative n=1 Tax=Babesia bigemina TaxID=5866 RepID=A0A061D6S0_BABBI|nr:asparagine synthase, putative [Babesia bigemina]CDR95707.1 asparagine synthase, putative [Babesia bigemina]|eukprot:XP_012767893.1 asparagine synthase, putative [Babesia bigemina]
MALARHIRLVVKPLVEIPGVDDVESALKKCNATGLVEIDEDNAVCRSTADCSRNGGRAVSDSSVGNTAVDSVRQECRSVARRDAAPAKLHRETLVWTSHDGITQVRFCSDQSEFELTGTDVKPLDEYTIVAFYGSVERGCEDVLKERFVSHESATEALMRLTGSFSIVYVSFRTNTVYVFKDEIGIRSLLWGRHDGVITVTDVAFGKQTEWYEIPPEFMITIHDEIKVVNRGLTMLQKLCHQSKIAYSVLTIDDVNHAIQLVYDGIASAVVELCDSRSIRDRVTILFSGGLDSSLLASMVAQHVKDLECIELVNVAFKPKVAPDRITAICTYEDLTRIYPEVNFKLILVDVETEEYKKVEQELMARIMPNNTHMDLNIAAALHYAVALKGTVMQPQFIHTEEWQEIKQNVALMKSINLRVTISKGSDTQTNNEELDGGKDGTCENEHSTDNTRKHDRHAKTASDESDVVDVLWEQLIQLRGSVNAADEDYTSPSKHVIIGSGADELFGGYGRHAVAPPTADVSFSKEVNKDIRRLWKRNLGRDDRVVNAQGVTALYPFLHPSVIRVLTHLKLNAATVVDALECPEWVKSLGVYQSLQYSTFKNCEFLHDRRNREVAIYINKWILREIAVRIGLKHCVHFKKRAIQFGTRSAKTFNRLRGMSNRVASDKGATIIMNNDL